MLYLFFQKKEMLGVDPFGIHPNIYYRTFSYAILRNRDCGGYAR